MINVPIAFILSFVLSLLLLWVVTGYKRRVSFIPKLALCMIAIQSVLIGLRWTYDIRDALMVQVTLATLIPPFVLLSMRQMASTVAAREPIERILLYCTPALIVLLLQSMLFPYVDLVIEAVFIGFGTALIYLGFVTDIEWRDRVPFQGLMEASVAFVISGCALILSALVDLAVTLDVARNGGQLAPQILGIANLVILVCIAAGVLLLSHRANGDEIDESPAALNLNSRATNKQGTSDDDTAKEAAAFLKHMDAVIIERKFYRDPSLSLDRLSRKLLVPARQISLAVNSQRAINVSQYINMFRVMEAAYLIRTQHISITEVIYEVGFNTKSNFNREFKRIVGISPSAWREGQESIEGSPMRSFQGEIAAEVAWAPAQVLHSAST